MYSPPWAATILAITSAAGMPWCSITLTKMSPSVPPCWMESQSSAPPGAAGARMYTHVLDDVDGRLGGEHLPEGRGEGVLVQRVRPGAHRADEGALLWFGFCQSRVPPPPRPGRPRGLTVHVEGQQRARPHRPPPPPPPGPSRLPEGRSGGLPTPRPPGGPVPAAAEPRRRQLSEDTDGGGAEHLQVRSSAISAHPSGCSCVHECPTVPLPARHLVTALTTTATLHRPPRRNFQHQAWRRCAPLQLAQERGLWGVCRQQRQNGRNRPSNRLHGLEWLNKVRLVLDWFDYRGIRARSQRQRPVPLRPPPPAGRGAPGTWATAGRPSSPFRPPS